MSNENGPIFKNKWPEAIRDLIKHENTLTISRVGWVGVFQGFLFTALSFTWDKGIGVVSLTTLLCALGILFSILSFWSLMRADKAIKILVGQWRDYKRRLWGSFRLKFVNTTVEDIVDAGRSLIIVGFGNKKLHIRIFDANGKRVIDMAENQLVSGETLKNFKEQLNPLPKEADLKEEEKQDFIQVVTSVVIDLPPVWGLISEQKQGSLLGIRNKSLYERVKLHIREFSEAPWLLLPITLFFAWLIILGFHIHRLELREPDQTWQTLAQAQLEKALSYDDKSKAEQEITTLARIHGNAADGKNVFNNFCGVRCHGKSGYKSPDQLAELNRKQIVSGILYPNQHRMDDFITSISTKRFVDVVEYLSTLKPKKVEQ